MSVEEPPTFRPQAGARDELALIRSFLSHPSVVSKVLALAGLPGKAFASGRPSAGTAHVDATKMADETDTLSGGPGTHQPPI